MLCLSVAFGKQFFPLAIYVSLHLSDVFFVSRLEEVSKSALRLKEILDREFLLRLVVQCPVFTVLNFEQRPEACVDSELSDLDHVRSVEIGRASCRERV